MKRRNLKRQKHDMINPNKPLFHLETWIGFWFWYLLVCFGIGYLIGVSLK